MILVAHVAKTCGNTQSRTLRTAPWLDHDTAPASGQRSPCKYTQGGHGSIRLRDCSGFSDHVSRKYELFATPRRRNFCGHRSEPRTNQRVSEEAATVPATRSNGHCSTTKPSSSPSESDSTVTASATQDLPLLAIPHAGLSLPVMTSVQAAAGLCSILWLVDGEDPSVQADRRALERFGQVVDLAGRSAVTLG